ISKLLTGFPNLLIQEVVGCDPLASYETIRSAVAYCRARRGPALVHAHVIRPYSHSQSDDEKLYRPAEELDDETRRDPIRAFPLFLINEGLATEAEIKGISEEVDAELNAAADEALASPKPAKETATLYVYSPDVDPTSKDFDTSGKASVSPASEQDTRGPKTMLDLINACLHDEM